MITDCLIKDPLVNLKTSDLIINNTQMDLKYCAVTNLIINNSNKDAVAC